MHAKKTAFVVEHDFIMATYLADRVVVYDGEPGIETTAHTPQSLLTGTYHVTAMIYTRTHFTTILKLCRAEYQLKLFNSLSSRVCRLPQ
jgi:ABC-type nitrate/sulfonate/bicarbonate transport system ATPase subunit